MKPQLGGDEVGARVALPVIIEVKRTLAGTEKRFNCAVLAREGTQLIVLFVASTAMHVHGVDLPVGTITFGHFWTDRPYNVYHWLDPRSGSTIGYYLNLSEQTQVTENCLEWLDLVVDILVIPPHPAVVLDEDEVPHDASAELLQRIERARRTTLADLPGLVAELEERRATLWPLVKARGTST